MVGTTHAEIPIEEPSLPNEKKEGRSWGLSGAILTFFAEGYRARRVASEVLVGIRLRK